VQHQWREKGRHTDGKSEITPWYVAYKKPQLLRYDNWKSPIFSVSQYVLCKI